MAEAHILFMSHENLLLPPEEWARAALARFRSDIVVIGLGAEGCLLAVRRDGYIGRIPAVSTGRWSIPLGRATRYFRLFCMPIGCIMTPTRRCGLQRCLPRIKSAPFQQPMGSSARMNWMSGDAGSMEINYFRK